MGKHAPYTVSMSVEYKGRWTCASYTVDMLKVDPKLSQSLREFLGMHKHRRKKKDYVLRSDGYCVEHIRRVYHIPSFHFRRKWKN